MIVGGYSHVPSDQGFAVTEIFRGATKSFETGAQLPYTKASMCAARLANGAIVFAGGYQQTDAHWIDKPEFGGTWNTLDNMSTARGYSFCGGILTASGGPEYVIGGKKDITS